MSLIDVKCPNCGASIQLDDNREFGFCSYCGSKVQLQNPTVNKIVIDKSGDVQTYLDLAQAAIDADNGIEAYNYANKALEFDAKNAKGWYMKMQALGLLGTLRDLKCNEVIAAGQKAIEYANSPEMELKVYAYYLYDCVDDLEYCIRVLQDVEYIQSIYNNFWQSSMFTATERTIALDSDHDAIWRQIGSILQLRLAVPDSKISSDKELVRIVEEIAKQWILFQNAFNERYNVYGTSMNDSTLERFKKSLERIKQGLPEQTIEGEGQLTNEKKSGCYIATAVYGSYCAPEVLVLRKFRDVVLRWHFYGNAFIMIYYWLSPSFAKRLKHSQAKNDMIKTILDKWVIRLQKKYHF